MLWLRLPWLAFSVVRGYAPLEVYDIYLPLDIPDLIAMGDRRDMLEYGRRFSPMQSRAEQGMLAIKWPASMVSLSTRRYRGESGEDYLYHFLEGASYQIGTLTVGGKTFWAYDFPADIVEFLTTGVTIGGEIEVEEGFPPPVLIPPPLAGGWCEAQLDLEGEVRWRWGSDYPQRVYPFEVGMSNDFLEFMQEQTPFIDDAALLGLLGLEDWPTGDERWIRMGRD